MFACFVLNLPFAMLRALIVFFYFISQASTPTPEILPVVAFPAAGTALQGVVTITGVSEMPGFQYAEINFRYAGGASNWFLIQQSRAPVKDGTLAVWDTSTIADGVYDLRLQVFLENGKVVEMSVQGLRVRNYTPVETSAPTRAALSEGVPIKTATPTAPAATVQPTPTRLPANPATIETSTLAFNIIFGVVFVLVLFGLLGIYRIAKNRTRESKEL
jgi:hypothetical protein